MKLVFIGFQEDGLGGRFKLWNVFNSPRPDLHPDGSTVSEYSLKEMSDNSCTKKFVSEGD